MNYWAGSQMTYVWFKAVEKNKLPGRSYSTHRLTSWGGQLCSFQEWSNEYISILCCVLLLFDCKNKQFLESPSLAAMKKIFPHVRPQSCQITTAPPSTHGVMFSATKPLPGSQNKPEMLSVEPRWHHGNCGKRPPRLRDAVGAGSGSSGQTPEQWSGAASSTFSCSSLGEISQQYPNSIPTSHLSALSKNRCVPLVAHELAATMQSSGENRDHCVSLDAGGALHWESSHNRLETLYFRALLLPTQILWPWYIW